MWIPKYRRKVLYGETRREVGEILRALAERMDGVFDSLRIAGSSAVKFRE